MVTPDTTARPLAERVARTREIYAELAALWGDEMPSVGLHNRSHEEIHNAEGVSLMAVFCEERWTISITLGERYPYGARLFADMVRDCRKCDDLIWKQERAVAEQRAEALAP